MTRIAARDKKLNGAFHAWANVLMKQQAANYHMFYDFCQVGNYKDDYYQITELGRNRLDQLLGPHAETIIRAWFAINDYPWDAR
jgi:hypothetical protein